MEAYPPPTESIEGHTSGSFRRTTSVFTRSLSFDLKLALKHAMPSRTWRKKVAKLTDGNEYTMPSVQYIYETLRNNNKLQFNMVVPDAPARLPEIAAIYETELHNNCMLEGGKMDWTLIDISRQGQSCDNRVHYVYCLFNRGWIHMWTSVRWSVYKPWKRGVPLVNIECMPCVCTPEGVIPADESTSGKSQLSMDESTGKLSLQRKFLLASLDMDNVPQMRCPYNT